jgi:hypothetical protein
MTWLRLGVGAGGLAAATYGFVVMGESGLTNIVRTLYWLAGGVIAHDGLLAPATLVIVGVATRLLPAWARGPAAVGLLVLGSLTLMAIPVLGRFGARPDNPTLLDRNYTAGWLLVATITCASVVAVALVRRRSWLTTAEAGQDGARGESSGR